jgi:hypothetical protein
MVGDVGNGRGAREERDDQQTNDFPSAPERDFHCERAVATPAHPGQAVLVTGDEREGRRERHLEARVGDGFGRQKQHAERCDRERTERERRAINHDADEDDGDHDEGALGRNLRARQQKIERRRRERGERRPFLDCVDMA